MSIHLANVIGGVGAPDVAWLPTGVSIIWKAGDVVGETTGGLAGLLNNHAGGTPIAAVSGIFGIAVNDDTSDANGRWVSPSVATGIDPSVPAVLALPTYGRRVTPAPPIAGVRKSQMECWLASPNNYFIQRHKQGTRVNDSLAGKLCDLTWNDTTLEWEVDTTSTAVNSIVVAPAGLQLPLYRDNTTLWDSATFATDTYGAWLVFQFVPTQDASKYGLRYASIVSAIGR